MLFLYPRIADFERSLIRTFVTSALLLYTYPYGVARSVEKRLDTNLGVMDDSNLTEKVA